jgi:dynein assembly factor 3
MNLKRIENASVIHIRQYRDWRNTGIAFEFGDQTYTEPNRSMASFTEVGSRCILHNSFGSLTSNLTHVQAKKRNHGSVLCRGLWTDIIVSPYISFGVDCDAPNKLAEQLFEIHNKGTGVEQNRHVSTRPLAFQREERSD